jgi:hypothetical protein
MNCDLHVTARLATTGVCTVLFWSILTASGIDYDKFARNCDPSIPGVQRVENLYRLLIEEVKTPTAPFRSEAGAEINHEYLLWNITVALWHAVEFSPVAKTSLLQKLRNEPRAEGRQVIQIALGLAGEKSVMKELAIILNSGKYVTLRGEAAGALHRAGGVLAAPVLIEALQGPVAPIAARHLEDFGVKVIVHSVNGANRYEVDKSSALGVLTRVLACKDQDAASLAIDAITEIGGKEAETELQRFIAENAGKPERSALVTKARQSLLRIKRADMPAPCSEKKAR